ncbi:MAG: Glutamyl-tRNA synthetase [Leptospirillum sp. Group II 'C75']|uniref:glutamate--tRNA ligase n=1 Tax=Leptospirillum sp. Group II 'CF-1' TaxID=1660083 RepID=UPI0000F0C83C|nr:glutamate--tRNA ligase [Leptospirillum sp. Group II 'CF-1']AKS24500.1 glutamyl-tRNA synthetase [Leptospirillum sp. Group II 'CF-1']EAY58127.1 MAG: Glutamyl-tRNA synthetase [Leptospirillum rubarum]EIJ76511.1 MAG: Glutamyl-tRNA synthetase [Leptospirillum sp. Group II 'C75']
MTDAPIRVRFAPSPTGHLHLGGARTALFNYLFARHHHGTFVLRIEDTDRERSTKESIQAIFNGLEWLSIDWDEGPFYQSERLDKYKAVSDSLLESGKAYRCFCTPQELETRRQEALAKGQPPKYDGRCRSRNDQPQGPYVIRFKNPEIPEILVEDMIRGSLSFNGNLLDDWVLVRSDGYPTYNFAVVVDDIDMNISHVIRGDDHINNTPRQITLFQALGASLPKFAHIPMIHGSDRAKLSKRHGATSVMAYKDMGYLPHALVNYIARLGWSHKDQEVFTKEELIQFFDLDKVGSSPAIFNTEKLLWLNAQYMKNTPSDELSDLVKPFLKPVLHPIEYEAPDSPPTLSEIIEVWKSRSRTLQDLADSVYPFMDRDFSYSEDVLSKHLTKTSVPLLQAFKDRFEHLSQWDKPSLEHVIHELGEEFGLKLSQLAQPLRAALTGQSVSPGIYDVLLLLGRLEVKQRIQNALSKAGGPF